MSDIAIRVENPCPERSRRMGKQYRIGGPRAHYKTLRAEQEAFLDAVRGQTPVPVTGMDGLKALELAQAVVASGLEHCPFSFAQDTHVAL